MSGVPATTDYFDRDAVLILIEFVVFLLLKAYLFSPAWLGAAFFGLNEWIGFSLEVHATHPVNSSCAAQLCRFNL
jgi:hypothetical protein